MTVLEAAGSGGLTTTQANQLTTIYNKIGSTYTANANTIKFGTFSSFTVTDYIGTVVLHASGTYGTGTTLSLIKNGSIVISVNDGSSNNKTTIVYKDDIISTSGGAAYMYAIYCGMV